MTTALQQVETQFSLPLTVHALGNQQGIRFLSHQQPLLSQWHHLIEAIRQSATKSQWITLINPPFIPNDDYLNEIGLGDFYIRIIQFQAVSDTTNHYIQQCLQNGKSSVVAVWAAQQADLPAIVLDERPVGCRALIFSDFEAKNKATVHSLAS